MIATQGPMGLTTMNFWRMVLNERVGMVVTLCHKIGGNGGDCVQYFPASMEEPTMKSEKIPFQVTLVSE